MTPQQMRQRIQLEFRRQQLMLDKEALALLVEHVEQAATGLNAVYSIIEKLEAGTKYAAPSIAVLPRDRLRDREYRFAQTTILASPGHWYKTSFKSLETPQLALSLSRPLTVLTCQKSDLTVLGNDFTH